MTGTRKDPVAKARPLQVEHDKPPAERGYYLHPELYGESDTKDLAHARYEHIGGQGTDLARTKLKPVIG